MPRLEIGEARQQPADRQRRHRTDAQHLAIVATLETFQRSGDAVERLAQRRQQRFAFRRQHQAARQPVEQDDVQLAFEALYVMADGGLRHAQLDRRLGEAKVPRRSFECPQRAR